MKDQLIKRSFVFETEVEMLIIENNNKKLNEKNLLNVLKIEKKKKNNYFLGSL
jgi:hypothetical protein